jgi:anti-sigma B factor antagonist
MSVMVFTAATRQQGDVAILDLSGNIDRAAEPSLTAAWERAVAGNPPTVLLNFSNVEYINSTGIALIVGLLARARQNGRGIVVCGLSDHYRQIFEITRLIDFMRVYPDEASAVASAATPV